MKCLIDPEPNGNELSLFHRIYHKAAELLHRDGRLEPVAFFRAGASPSIPGLKHGMLVRANIEIPDSDDGKDAAAEELRDFVKQTDSDLVLLVLESWMVKPTEEEAAYFKQEGSFPVRPSKHPNRIEIVLFSLEKPGGDQWSVWVAIQRDGEGKPSIPAEPPKLEYLRSCGRFGNLFSDQDAVPIPTTTDGGEKHESAPSDCPQ
jgi:hypothetical protein